MAGEATDRPPIGVAVGVGMPSLAPLPKPSPREGVEEEDCMARQGGVGATKDGLAWLEHDVRPRRAHERPRLALPR